MPLAFESFGLVGKDVVSLISSLAEKVSELRSLPYVLLLSYWKKRLSTTLQIGTAKFIMDASASFRHPSRRMSLEDSVLSESYHIRSSA